MPKIVKTCPTCEKAFSVFPSGQKRKFCSVSCKRLDTSGEKNSNFGKYWTLEQKLNQSELIKSKVTDSYREKSGSSNRGKKFSADRVQKMHAGRSSESYSHLHSNKTKSLIGQLSRERMQDPEYKRKLRTANEQAGRWISLDALDEFTLYKRESHWVQRMWNLVDCAQLLEHGVFHAVKNPNGCVRDHRYSKFDGFANRVPPEILRHPVNCQVLTHSTNSQKRHKSSISLEELFSDIQTYNGNWCEHNQVLILISKYLSGFRWSKSFFLEQKGGGYK